MIKLIPGRYKWYSRWTQWLAFCGPDPLGAEQLSQPGDEYDDDDDDNCDGDNDDDNDGNADVDGNDGCTSS